MKLWPESVRSRLTLWYSLILAAMVSVFAGASLYVLQHVLASRTDRFLEQARDAFITELEVEIGEMPTTAAAVGAAMSDVRFRDIRFLVFERDFRLIAASDESGWSSSKDARSAGGPLPPLDRRLLAERLASGGFAEPALVTIPDRAGGYRVAVRPVVLRGARHAVAAVQARHGLRETLERVALAYVVAIPLFLALAAQGGYLLARRALSPVAAMSRRAREIGATNLHERLPVENPRDELGELAAMVNDLLGRLEGSFERQRRFVADASHELRTPVAIVRAESEIALGRESRPATEYRDALRVVHDAGHRLSRVVDDLFLLARADGGHQPLRREMLYLDELTGDAVRSIRGLAAQRSVRVDVGPLPEAPFVGDAELLARMLLNLLDNAVKYSPEGSAVLVGLTREADLYRLSVADAASGIPPHAQPHIFERFFRVDKARSRPESTSTNGAGLGLAIARWVAEAHAGRLELAHSTAAGSEFVVTLPADKATDAIPRDGGLTGASEDVETGQDVEFDAIREIR